MVQPEQHKPGLGGTDRTAFVLCPIGETHGGNYKCTNVTFAFSYLSLFPQRCVKIMNACEGFFFLQTMLFFLPFLLSYCDWTDL